MSFWKTSLAVFVGIIAAFVAIMMPSWINIRRREARSLRISQALASLTPQQAILRCGIPLSDTGAQEIARGTESRTLYYQSSHGIALLVFLTVPGTGWNLTSMRFTDSLDSKVSIPAFQTEEEKLLALPCLGNR